MSQLEAELHLALGLDGIAVGKGEALDVLDF